MKNRIYYIATREGRKEVEGHKINIYDNIETFTHKDLNWYYINEFSTGVLIAIGHSLKGAKETCLAIADINKKVEYVKDNYPKIN